jgi:hypothetical protein
MAADSAVKGIRSRDATGVITYAAGDVADLFELGFEAVGDLDPRMEAFADSKEPSSRRGDLLSGSGPGPRRAALEYLGKG